VSTLEANGAGLPADSVHAFIRERRSIRRFEERPIPHPMLERILETALWAPSPHNRQPWRFVVITDAALKSQLADAMASRLAADLRADGLEEALILKDTSRSRQRISGAPAAVMVCLSMADMDSYPDAGRQAHEHQMAAQGTAMAAQNLLLAAHSEGLGACWLCAPLFCPDTVRECLELPADFEPQGMIVMGYPDETRQKTREPLETRVVFR
jgi:coenzyme F420-0:L-glutamate ligase / coenzyme F420-1:gamma-L-glutamate ligase